MKAFRGPRRMAEYTEKTLALDDPAQFAAAIEGALEAGTLDSLCSSQARVRDSSRRTLHTIQGQTVTIGKRLRDLCKKEKLSRRNIAKKRGCFTATCGVWKLTVKFRGAAVELEKTALWRVSRLNSISQLKMLARTIRLGACPFHAGIPRNGQAHHFVLAVAVESNRQCKPLCVDFTAVFEVRTPK